MNIKKSEKEKMIAGEPYIDEDEELNNDKIRAKALIKKYNSSEFNVKLRKKILEEITGQKYNKIYIEPPFYFDFGYNISIGETFYANFNLCILDCGKVTIGNDVMIGPNVQIYAVGHPISPKARASGAHIGLTKPITIGNNVWIGGNSTIVMGVTIGDNTIIGAGSVVTKNIPANVVAAGNPCKVIRNIEEE